LNIGREFHPSALDYVKYTHCLRLFYSFNKIIGWHPIDSNFGSSYYYFWWNVGYIFLKFSFRNLCKIYFYKT
jgi:hypothetical protein